MKFGKKVSATPSEVRGPESQSHVMINNWARMMTFVDLVLAIWLLLKNFVDLKMALLTLVLYFTNEMLRNTSLDFIQIYNKSISRFRTV